jgi:hypothetical protein
MRQSHARLLSTIAILLVVLTGALSAVRGAMASQPSTRHTGGAVSAYGRACGWHRLAVRNPVAEGHARGCRSQSASAVATPWPASAPS